MSTHATHATPTTPDATDLHRRALIGSSTWEPPTAAAEVERLQRILDRAVSELAGVYQGMGREEILNQLMAGRSLMGDV